MSQLHTLARYVPSSSRMWNTCAGERSTKRSERSTSRIWPISSSVSLFGGAGRGLIERGLGGDWRRECVARGRPTAAHAARGPSIGAMALDEPVGTSYALLLR